jgi:CubicO group peptidase (beta-lactamase class C family)
MLGVLTILLLTLLVSCSSNRKTRQAEEAFDISLRAALDTLPIVGMGISLITPQEVLWSKCYGFANREEGKPYTGSTLQMLGSVSKLVTGSVLLKLFDQDFFTLDDDINDALPFTIRNPAYPEQAITYRMLLTHTSSIADNQKVINSLYTLGDSEVPLDTLVEHYFKPSGNYYSDLNYHDYPPGGGYQYSNMGFVLIAYIIEQFTELPFHEYCERELFSPLDMKTSRWFLADVDTANVAVQYWRSSDTSDAMTAVPHYGWAGYPDGQLRSSITEFGHFLQLLLNQGSFRGAELFKPATIDSMFTLQDLGRFTTVRDFTNKQKKDLGLIWHFDLLHNDREVFIHDGWGAGLRNFAFIDSRRTYGVVCLVTGDLSQEQCASLLVALSNGAQAFF